MADTKISALTAVTKSTIATADVFPVVQTSGSTTKNITYGELINPQSNNFAVVDNGDTSKKVALNVSGVTTATTRTLTIPDANTTIVGTDTTQTLTAKTLTSPVINVTGDATGDLYYRNSGGLFTRLAAGATNTILSIVAGIPAWVSNPSAANASTTVAGIVEAATAAEVTAGTGTGGTGAVLAVTPDALASSAPTFSGANLTNLPFKGIFKSGTTTKNAADASTTQTIAHGLGTTPKFVTIKAISFGSSGASDSIPAFADTAYNGTTQSSVSFFTTGTSFSGSAGITTTTFTLNISGTAPSQTDGVLTFDATNISIAWTKASSPTGTYKLLWTAMA